MKNLSYVPSVDEATANRDLGVMRDVSAPGQQDGTPIRQDYMNDFYYMSRAMLNRVGMTPDDSQEGILTSQFVEALIKNIKSVQTAIDANTTFDEIFNDTDAYFSPTANRTANIATNGSNRQGNIFTLYNSSATYKVTLTYYSTNTFDILPNEYAKFLWNGTRWIIIESNSQEFLGWEECFYSMSRTAEISSTNHIYELTVTGDKTEYFKNGQKIKFTQNAAIVYAIITYVETSGGNTILTVFSGTDYTISANAITNVKLSKINRPYDFNCNKNKWSIIADIARYVKTSPVQNTWYNTSTNIYKEKGDWNYKISFCMGGNFAGQNADFSSVISESSSSASNSFNHVETTSYNIIASTFEKNTFIKSSKRILSYLLITTTSSGVSNISVASIGPGIIIYPECL